MDYNFKNIIDFLLYAMQHMCTRLVCTTCGAMEYRHLCYTIGKVEIKRLIESVTDEDIEQMPTSVSYWAGVNLWGFCYAKASMPNRIVR